MSGIEHISYQGECSSLEEGNEKAGTSSRSSTSKTGPAKMSTSSGKDVGTSNPLLGVLSAHSLNEGAKDGDKLEGGDEIGGGSNNTVVKSEIPEYAMEEIIDSMPVGRFHWRLLMLCGLAFCADAMEVTLLGFVSTCAGVEWGLSHAQTASITAAVFAGEFIGGLFWGPVADKYGRRKAFIACILIISITGICAGFSPNYGCLVTILFIGGFGVGGLTVPFDLLAELVPTHARGTYLVRMNYFWTCGSLAVIATAWGVLSTKGWEILTILTAIPVVAASIFSVLWLPESPRWLLEQGEVEEAEKVIKEAILFNEGGCLEENEALTGGDKPAGRTTNFRLLALVDCEAPEELEGEGFMHLMRTQGTMYANLMKVENIGYSLPLWLLWISFGFAYYGVILFVARLYNAGGSDTENGLGQCNFRYSEIFINASSELVGLFISIYVIDTLGRPQLMFVTFAMSGLFSLLMAVKSTDADTLIMACMARAFIVIANSTVWVATPELYKTSLRATGHASCNAWARIGAFIVPFVVQSALSPMTVGTVLLAVNLVGTFGSLMIPDMTGRDIDNPNVDMKTGKSLNPNDFYLFGGVPKNIVRGLCGSTFVKDA